MRALAPLALLLVGLLAACQSADDSAALPAPPEEIVAMVDSVTLRMHLAELASDAYEGRGTGTPGEERAVAYIAEQMEAYGLEPAAGDGSFFQPVPLMGSTPTNVSPLTLDGGEGGTAALSFVNDYIASTDLDTAGVALTNIPLVFVGYGIDNPGYTWDDYKDVDVAGKIIVAFVNDPPATEAEPNLFQADTLTYNGRWTYKYEEARRRGAVGALLIHTVPTAGYPFQVLSAGARGEQIALAEPPEGALAVKGWLTQASAERLAEMAGTTLDDWFRLAATRDFAPQELGVTASWSADFSVRQFEGTNVIGRLPGTSNADEAVVYTAHHDHLGIDQDLVAAGEDGIYNGAVDNASGVAMLLTIAKALSEAPEAPERSVYFITLSAEESGLLGAGHYALNPVVPLGRTVANINVDSGNLGGPTDDIVGIGAERSEMMDLLQEASAAEGLFVTMDPEPNQGLFFRSDQLAFARGGVPAVFINTGRSYRGQPENYAEQLRQDYNQNRYHQPSDEYTGDEPLEGALQQARVALRMGYALAYSGFQPAWNPTEAFAETRAASQAE